MDWGFIARLKSDFCDKVRILEVIAKRQADKSTIVATAGMTITLTFLTLVIKLEHGEFELKA